ncbi:MAG TPA: ABC transporter ATP-binding protein [Alphaproteobacteria bacterium]|nr:ABC transporter ATP-binding protein [Alphaproteobacteria bacterium]
MLKPFLEIDHVGKWFPVERTPEPIQVIDDVSLGIAEGEFVAFLGPSGCGKTTLMRIIGGLDRPSKGRILLEGEEVKGPDRRKGVVFQSYSSFPWLTVIENVLFGLKFRTDLSRSRKDEIAQHYIDLVGLSAFANFYVNRISGGMRQRVAIARTLAAGPDVLLMDEPFGALDAQNREFLQIQLLEICAKERKTTVFVTHDVEEAIFLSERIVVFSARPAIILEEVRVADHLPLEHDVSIKDSEAFIHLRNKIMTITRAQARRTEEQFAQTARPALE